MTNHTTITPLHQPGSILDPLTRGLANMKIQAFLTAAAVNLKRLAASFCDCLHACGCQRRPRGG
jgi:hypothetical protein